MPTLTRPGRPTPDQKSKAPANHELTGARAFPGQLEERNALTPFSPVATTPGREIIVWHRAAAERNSPKIYTVQRLLRRNISRYLNRPHLQPLRGPISFSSLPEDIFSRLPHEKSLSASSHPQRETMATMPAATIYPQSHVGFDSITSQIERKLLKRGFQFNVICVGKLTSIRSFQASVRCRPGQTTDTCCPQQARPAWASRP